MAANESAAVAACKTYVEAQDIYRRTDWEGEGVREYAQGLRGEHSLFEKTYGAGDLVLIDAAFANAEGLPGDAQPKAGYVFKVLTAQGPSAAGGRRSYLTSDRTGQHLTEGFALAACPASWDGTGRNTFLINQTGVVYQKDLGPETPELFKKMTEYDPDKTWVMPE